MATLSLITGSVLLPDDTPPVDGILKFVLSGVDTDGVTVIAPYEVKFALEANGDIPAGCEIYINGEGLRGTIYTVFVYHSLVDAFGVAATWIERKLGTIQINTAGPHDLTALLNAGAPTVPGTWVRSITEEEYNAAIAAAATATAAAAVLEGFAVPTWGTFTTDATLTNGRGPYALPYDPGNVAYVDLTVGGLPQVPTTDFTLVYSGSVAQILLAFDMPSGAVCNYRLQRPLQADPNAQFLTPEQFSAVGGGVEDDTAAVIAAVAMANFSRRTLIMDQIYLTSSSIPGYHECSKVGTGALKIGSTLVYVKPVSTDQISLYVDVAGDDLNDGLSSGRAVATISRALNIIRLTENFVVGQWTINLTAGTYVAAEYLTGLTNPGNRITIQGPSVGGHPNVPTALITGPTTSSKCFNLDPGDQIRLIDVKFTGLSLGQAVNNNGGILTLINVHTSGVLNPVVALHHAKTSFTGGIYDGTGTSGGIGYSSFYDSTHDSGATSTAEATIFQNFSTNMQLGEGAQGHLDWIITQDSAINVDFKRNCGACNTYKMTNRRGGIGIRGLGGSIYLNQIIWGTGADANTVNVDLRGSAPEVKRQTADYAMQAMRFNALQEVIPTVTLASTGVLQPLFAGPLIPDWAVSEGGGQIEFTACLRLALTGNMALRVYLAQGTTVDQFANITVNAAATALYLTVRGSFDSAASFRGYIDATDSAGTKYLSNSDAALDFKNTEGNFLIQISGTATNTITGWSCRYGDTVCG